jgi:hypothetical protein
MLEYSAEARPAVSQRRELILIRAAWLFGRGVGSGPAANWAAGEVSEPDLRRPNEVSDVLCNA